MSSISESSVTPGASYQPAANVKRTFTQDQILARATEALIKADITVEGKVIISLGLDEAGNVAIGGDARNKDEIASALNSDTTLKTMLKNQPIQNGRSENNTQAGNISPWPTEAYSVSISGEALTAVSNLRSSELNIELSSEQLSNVRQSNDLLELSHIAEKNKRIVDNTIIGGIDFETASYDEMGFSDGKDVSFSTALFDSLDERNSLYNYLQNKITAAIPGLDNIAGIQFDLKQDRIDSPYYVVAKNYKYDDETLAAINQLIHDDPYAIKALLKGENNCQMYQTVLEVAYSTDQQTELGIMNDRLRQQDSGIRFYSPVTSDNQSSIKAAGELWQYTQSLSDQQYELLYAQVNSHTTKNQLILTRSEGTDGAVTFKGKLCDIVYDDNENPSYVSAALTYGDTNTRDLILSFCQDESEQMNWANTFDESSFHSQPSEDSSVSTAEIFSPPLPESPADIGNEASEAEDEEQHLPAAISHSSWSYVRDGLKIPEKYDANLEKAKELERLLAATIQSSDTTRSH